MTVLARASERRSLFVNHLRGLIYPFRHLVNLALCLPMLVAHDL